VNKKAQKNKTENIFSMEVLTYAMYAQVKIGWCR